MATGPLAAAARRFEPTFTLCFLAAMAEGFDIQSMGVAAPTEIAASCDNFRSFSMSAEAKPGL